MAASCSASYSATLRVKLKKRPGAFAIVAACIGEKGGDIGEVLIVEENRQTVVREITYSAPSAECEHAIAREVGNLPGVELLDVYDCTFRCHEGGKISVTNKRALDSVDALSMAYTPGVARVCMAINDNPRQAFNYTIKSNTVAIVSDGTAVLGLGDIGPEAAMPVMEGKAMLFREFGGVEAFPICLDTKDPDEIIAIVKALAPTFGGINLEDISAPRCFVIEEKLKEMLSIPVFHDDQHGTAVVVLAALTNALKLTGKKIEDLKMVVVGIGAAGVACSKLLMQAGLRNIIGCDRKGAIYKGRIDNMNFAKEWYAENTNPECLKGELSDVIAGADLFLGLSGPKILSVDDLKKMNPKPIVFAMSNPVPEIMPEDAAPYVSVMATGRSDYPNQINNVLAFPGIFRGALDCRASAITEGMKIAAAEAIASLVLENELRPDYVIPSTFHPEVGKKVAAAVRQAAFADGVAAKSILPLATFAETGKF